MLFTRILVGLLLAIVLAGAARSADYPKPHRDPVPPTDAQRQLIREGIALHDQGQHDGAIAKYLQVLETNPDCTPAIYELCYALFAAGRPADALRHARRGMEYRSDQLASFYMTAGNCLDALDDPKEALRAYQAGIKLNPDEGLLYYNRAITRIHQDKLKPAVNDLKHALYRAPRHASSHLALGRIWHQQDNRVPALLALLRFVELEPASNRSGEALQIVTTMLNELVQVAGEGDRQQIQISLRSESPKNEGDFAAWETALAIALAAQTIGDSGKQPVDCQLLGAFNGLFSIMGDLAGKSKGRFVERYYVPYFIQLREKNLVDPWLYHVLQTGNLESVRTWREQNQVKLAYYTEWSHAYPWPGEK